MKTSYLLFGLLLSCTTMTKPKPFSSDLQFLRARDSVIVLQQGEAQLIVSPKYQGKVFTSTSDGVNSFGWINYKAFDQPLNPHMNAYGGENRLWLGPEGNRYSVFFTKGALQTFDNWHTPAPFDSEAWEVVTKNESSVMLRKRAALTNYAGTGFQVQVDRSIGVLSDAEIGHFLSVALPAGVKAVGYQTVNTLTNQNDFAWDSATGMPCIWMLDMLKPSDQTTIVIPYTARDSVKALTTDYFGEIAKDRIASDGGLLFFKADGKSRGKLGIHPACAKNVAGSYDAVNQVLTITLFDVDNHGKYLNQEWNSNKHPFLGDAVNGYNDGPLADGKQMGPFYEIESVSPAAALAPGGSLTHHHSVFHFTGSIEGLDAIAQKVLGVSLSTIQSALK